MGQWRITIDGHGCHHNSRPEIDADLATKDFLQHLKAQGHEIEAARFEMRSPMTNEVDPGNACNIDFLHPTPAEFVADPDAELPQHKAT